ncbi:MAG: cytidylyltransferase domain-containing protein [Gemmatimonadota bacterium]
MSFAGESRGNEAARPRRSGARRGSRRSVVARRDAARTHHPWILVPARGGSKGIPRKNARRLNGVPLIGHVLSELRTIAESDRIVVSTNDAEIARIASEYASIHERPEHLAGDEVTLDAVAETVAEWLLERGAEEEDLLITVQPTSPFLRAASVKRAVRLLGDGAASVISVRRDSHLRWTTDGDGRAVPLYEERLNRQELPPIFVETGGVIGVRIGDLMREGTRIQQPVSLLPLDAEEALDIDHYVDWAVAEYLVRRKRIYIRADASAGLGMGHVYRALALAHEFARHDLTLITRSDGECALGAEFLAARPYRVRRIERESEFHDAVEAGQPDVVILDVLDTEVEYVQRVKRHGAFVVSFEDLGPGSRHADLVINDLYTDVLPQPNHWYGVEFSVLAPPFDTLEARAGVASEVDGVLVTFGGTDPNNLTIKALEALAQTGFEGTVNVVCGPGYRHGDIDLDRFGLAGTVRTSVTDMAAVMQRADVAITSAGRTVTELMVAGVPTIVLCQNLRELRHTHASGPYGIINLGLGDHVAVSTLSEHIALLLEDRGLRAAMAERATKAVRDRSNEAICRRILQALDERSTGVVRGAGDSTASATP